MALSKKRESNIYKKPHDVDKPSTDNPRWLLPTAITLLILGPAWIVTYYISKAELPLPISDWNLLVGFAFMAGAMLLLTRWK
ncbi:cell division protein CrgA [Demequina sp. SO4-13]|uniref:cell division protein CrgA n=1 Tax=Demequina sp. SO4-13 TaxID=3401027 RepID=UPI003AF77C3B